MITAEQIADLRPGDVVRVTGWCGATVEGPVTEVESGEGIWLGELLWLSHLASWASRLDATLTVVSRAPRLYVNHPRTEPVVGDIVRDCDGDAWRYQGGEWYCTSPDCCEEDDPFACPIGDFQPLTLLWDGETGEVVP